MKIRVLNTKTGKKVKFPKGIEYSVQPNGKLLFQSGDGYDFDHVLFYSDDIEKLLKHSVTEFAFEKDSQTKKWIWTHSVVND